MSECQACAEAMANRSCGAYRADCLECSARAISHGPFYFMAAKSHEITPVYIEALQAVFCDDWIEGHARVKRWAERRAP